MRKFALALTAAAALTLGTSANAAKVLTITGPSGIFGNSPVSGNFSDTYTFDNPGDFGSANFTISSTQGDPGSELDFTNVSFNGTPFSTISTGDVEFRTLSGAPLLATNNVISVSGAAGSAAAYAGSIAFLSKTPAVPEPATWMFMLVGFGAVGYSMRKKTSVKFAQSV